MRQLPLAALAGIGGLVAGACAPGPPRLPAPAGGVPSLLRVQVEPGGRATVVPLEEYVEGSILSEVAPAAGDPAALGRLYDVQAVIARTYATANLGRHRAQGFDLCSTVHCQLYEPARRASSRWAALAAQAVSRTRGLTLWYDGAPVQALYHADCGGHTSAAHEVWNGPARPYLRAQPDRAPDDPHRSWEFRIEIERLRDALNRDSRTRVGRRLDQIAVVARDAAGRAARIRVAGNERDVIVRGEALRSVLTMTFGAAAVRSTWFHIRRTGETVVFEGRGFGHGAGLCQAGALARARAGASLEAILGFYYPGARLTPDFPYNKDGPRRR